MDLQLHEVYLRLSDQWPCQRERWWAVLYPAQWPSMNLQPWGVDEAWRQVQHFIPRWFFTAMAPPTTHVLVDAGRRDYQSLRGAVLPSDTGFRLMQ